MKIVSVYPHRITLRSRWQIASPSPRTPSPVAPEGPLTPPCPPPLPSQPPQTPHRPPWNLKTREPEPRATLNKAKPADPVSPVSPVSCRSGELPSCRAGEPVSPADPVSPAATLPSPADPVSRSDFVLRDFPDQLDKSQCTLGKYATGRPGAHRPSPRPIARHAFRLFPSQRQLGAAGGQRLFPRLRHRLQAFHARHFTPMALQLEEVHFPRFAASMQPDKRLDERKHRLRRSGVTLRFRARVRDAQKLLFQHWKSFNFNDLRVNLTANEGFIGFVFFERFSV